MIAFEELVSGIYRLKVPFEAIYTSVFLLRTSEADILLDGGPSPENAENHVLPALQKENANICLIVRSHCHGDHSGGVERIAEAFPAARIGLMEDDFPQNGKYIRLHDGDMLAGRFQVLHLPGHTRECLALLDTESKTLLSADSLQAKGIGKYGVSFTDRPAYLQSVERIRRLGVERIIASHAFAPYGFQAVGQQAVGVYLDACVDGALAKL